MTHMSTYGTLVCVFLCPKGRKAMKDRDFKRRIAYEVLIILGVLALLLFVCRLWPILLLVILGIFVAAIRLLFLSQTKVEVIQPMPPPTPKDPTEKDVQNMAYNVIQRKITELVTEAYPQARWYGSLLTPRSRFLQVKTPKFSSTMREDTGKRSSMFKTSELLA